MPIDADHNIRIWGGVRIVDTSVLAVDCQDIITMPMYADRNIRMVSGVIVYVIGAIYFTL